MDLCDMYEHQRFHRRCCSSAAPVLAMSSTVSLTIVRCEVSSVSIQSTQYKCKRKRKRAAFIAVVVAVVDISRSIDQSTTSLTCSDSLLHTGHILLTARKQPWQTLMVSLYFTTTSIYTLMGYLTQAITSTALHPHAQYRRSLWAM